MLRNGKKVRTALIEQVTIPDIVKMMVGKEMGAEFPFDESVHPGEEIFRVEDLRYQGNAHAMSFSLRRGELLGIAGLVGSGRTETLRAIFGADPKVSGKLILNGKPITVDTPKDAVRHGLCLLTEDRKEQGLILDMPCYVNVTLTDLAKVSRAGLLNTDEEKARTDDLVQDLAIRTPSVNQWVRNLSGGNQQKVVLAKWLFRQPEVLMFDEPTRGIDVGAKYEIYTLVWRLAAEGKGIIVVSSDLPELLGICHRILVFSNGKITGEVSREAFDQEKILALEYQEYIHTDSGQTEFKRG